VPFDLALVVDHDIPIAAIENTIWNSGGDHLIRVELFDFYRGEQIEEGKKSIAFSLTFSSKQRTLAEEEVNASVEIILKMLQERFGAGLRPA